MYKNNNYPKYLLIIYSIIWLLLAFNVNYRFDWFLENLLLFIIIPILIITYKKYTLSNTSYTLIFIMLTLHTIGAHYTYSEVPFGYWLQNYFQLSRNHYDRLVHFAFGFLITYPIKELLLKFTSKKSIWNYYLSTTIITSCSVIYEILEWLTAIIVAPQAGSAFLGTQGDEWDAQKDMALALLGSIISNLFFYLKQKIK